MKISPEFFTAVIIRIMKQAISVGHLKIHEILGSRLVVSLELNSPGT